jgi:ABC-type nickel/cobalt efflux system permease component RcnA
VIRVLCALALAALGGALSASSASAHPLGNFTTNHLSEITVSSDRVDVRYILDQAEIPTFQERGLSAGLLTGRKADEARRGLRLVVDGKDVPLRIEGRPDLSFPPGQGGLKTTRLELSLVGRVDGAARVELRDRTFDGRVGWKAIVVRPGEGTAVRSSVPSGDPTNGLRSYPNELLSSPLDQRTATLAVEPGQGTLVAPQTPGGREVTTRSGSGDGFAAVFDDATSGRSVLALLLAAAFAWGAFHALSPGHGKAMVAAYLAGTRGDAAHAVALGGVVTFTHTIGVFALGLVTLLLAQYVLPEDLYPWLTLVSGLLVVAVGAAVLRSRLRWARAGGPDHGDGSPEDHSHSTHHDDHSHSHDHHHMPRELSWRGVVGMGVSAGLIPCPSALVVLLGAMAQHELALGMLLILAFSAGLAATLTGLGLAVVYGNRLTSRLSFSGRFVAVLPTLSALLILGVGLVLSARAVPQIL